MKLLTTLLAVFCMCRVVSSQNGSSPDRAERQRSIIKLNLTAPIVKNYAVQYEQVINKFLSVAVSGRIMPASTLPFKNEIKNRIVKEDIELVDDIVDKTKFSNYALTPELRFYLGRKGYGRGFYIGPYYRFARYKMLKSNLSFDEGDDHYTIDLSGKVTAHTGGLLLGAQWFLGKNLGLDLWIAGPGLGAAKGTMAGVSTPTLTPDNQEELRKQLEKIDIPLTKETIYVDATGARIDLNGPWAGIRTGLLLSFRF
ncbi:DUF3575 domain-containing protein [Niabella drilacis]|uniref:DUF3575 domain-containing protein n=1 Tax=Niabella drilacis (strain DSM 25811 / CCM 8410 / CCUG 62505 / LMG 26954 / E90) TaxID=1285928 RepID=A0A1G6PZY4_NIADE|nr:DUF3575 domain-containing protein [Niabella drilacis]SDC85673.1 Protein of unknown function [Niabella drilacis]